MTTIVSANETTSQDEPATKTKNADETTRLRTPKTDPANETTLPSNG